MHAAEPPLRGASGTTGPDAFRDDINGLRAWAVLAVVLFHFGVPGFAGGFVGVDVFFVISGYLMTRIITQGLERGRFSYVGFCMARAVRILPALLVLCAVLLALAYFALAPTDYRNLATHAFSSTTFISNFKYWDEAGYFDAASHEKWLLHTWSLSVEWQFYLLLPALLMLAWARRPSRNAVLVLSLLVLALSLAFNLWATTARPTLAFFWLPSRAWEMLLGGLVFLWAEPLMQGSRGSDRMRLGLALAGLSLITLAVALFDGNSAWPGWRALVPTLGAALVITAARQGLWLTSHPLLRWTGERSYSIYLWHWPVYVAARYIGLSDDALVIAGMVALTAALAEASYRCVERPARAWLSGQPRRRSMAAVTAATLAVSVAAFGIRMLDGVHGRLPAAAEQAARQSEDWNSRRDQCQAKTGGESPSCRWGGEPDLPPSLAVVGDSHGDSIMTAVAAALPVGAGPAVQWTYSGCSFMMGSAPTVERQQRLGETYQCGAFQDWAARQIGQLPADVPLLIVNRYAGSLYGEPSDRRRFAGSSLQFHGRTPRTEAEAILMTSQAIIQTACAFTPQRRVILLRPLPEMPVDVPRTYSRRLMAGLDPEVRLPRPIYERRNGWVWKAQDEAVRRCGAEVLDPTSVLCDAQHCYGSRHGQLLYYDDDHLSETGNKVLVDMFSHALARPRDASPLPAARTATGTASVAGPQLRDAEQ